MKPDEESKTKKGNRVNAPGPFDELMKKLVRVRQPETGTTNKDYQLANERREKGKK